MPPFGGAGPQSAARGQSSEERAWLTLQRWCRGAASGAVAASATGPILLHAIVLPGRKSGFRAGFRPGSIRESFKIGPLAGGGGGAEEGERKNRTLNVFMGEKAPRKKHKGPGRTGPGPGLAYYADNRASGPKIFTVDESGARPGRLYYD